MQDIINNYCYNCGLYLSMNQIKCPLCRKPIKQPEQIEPIKEEIKKCEYKPRNVCKKCGENMYMGKNMLTTYCDNCVGKMDIKLKDESTPIKCIMCKKRRVRWKRRKGSSFYKGMCESCITRYTIDRFTKKQNDVSKRLRTTYGYFYV